MGRRSRRQEIGAEVIAKVQSGRTAKEVAEEYGLKVKTVYNWVASTAQSTGVNVNEIGRLKRENELLKAIIGKFVYEDELKKKRGFNL
jgi:predicted transcriptional regulator